MSVATEIPFVVGQWVRGPRFYGRRRECTSILAGEGRIWVAGLRRVGKTSLLKQLELLATAERTTIPLFWDLQSADSVQELGLGFADALFDSQEILQRQGIDLEEVESEDLFSSLERLRAALKRRRLRLLLLCDEAEELVRLCQREPRLRARLERAMQAFEGLRWVLASAIGVSGLEEPGQGLPLLGNCGAPLYLGPLTVKDGGALVRQAQLPEASRPRFDPRDVNRMVADSGGHTYLAQLLGKRCHDLGDLETATAQLATDRALLHLFEVDFALLQESEREVLAAVADPSTKRTGSVGTDASVARLLDLGLLRRSPSKALGAGNAFLARWLAQRR